jgi:hypothetical protein
MAGSNVIRVQMEVEQEKIDRLVAAEDRFREAASEMDAAAKEVRQAIMDLRDPFLLVQTTSKE